MKRKVTRNLTWSVYGYTILEAMIFLAVSGGLLMSTMVLFEGREQRTRFTQSVVTMNQDLQDLLNDVSVGYYPTISDFGCNSLGGTVNFTGGSTEQGKNAGCTFVGKIIQLQQDSSTYNSYTMVGLQGATSLSTTGARLLGISSNPGTYDTKRIGAGLQIRKVVSAKSPYTQYNTLGTGGIAIISEFPQIAAGPGASITGNASRVGLYAYTGNFSTTGALNTGAGGDFVNVSQSGVIICLEESGNDTKGALIVGESGQLSIERKVGEWPTGC